MGFVAKMKEANEKAKFGDTSGKFPGYYLQVGDTCYYMGSNTHAAAKNLEKACDKFLPNSNIPATAPDYQRYHYEVVWSHGLDVAGYIAWAQAYATDVIMSVYEANYC